MVYKKKANFWYKVIRIIINNWFLLIFFSCIAFVGTVSFYKLFVKQENFVYAQVKVSQGLWWASTQRPPLWLAQALKAQMQAKDLTGAAKARILSVRAYPYYGSNQYDLYLDLKLKVTGQLKTGTVNFNRSALTVGSPIELTFPTVELTGTVINLSSKLFKNNGEWLTITLIKSNSYQWEYEAIEIGDSYFDGQEKVLVVTDKQLEPNLAYSLDYYGGYGERSLIGLYPQPRYNLIITAKIKAKQDSGRWLYAQDQELKLGKTTPLSTDRFLFQDFVLAKITTD